MSKICRMYKNSVTDIVSYCNVSRHAAEDQHELLVTVFVKCDTFSEMLFSFINECK